METSSRTSSLSTDSERLTFLRARGYEIDAESDDTIYHLTELGSLAEPAVPDGYRLRTVEPADLEQRVEIHRAVWAPSRVTAESFANVQAAWPYRRDLDCVVEAPDGSFAAYCLAWLDDANRVGEFEPVGTHPDYHRRGLAREPCAGSRSTGCGTKGQTRGIVYSIEGFVKTALYESIGMREHARSLELVKRR